MTIRYRGHAHALVSGKFKLLVPLGRPGALAVAPPEPLIFDLEADPGELKPLRDEASLAVRDRLLQRQQAFLEAAAAIRESLDAGDQEVGEIPDALRKRLESLGYLNPETATEATQ